MKPLPKPVRKSFKATLERMQSNLGWVIIRIPLDVPKVWGVRGMLKVKGEINGFAFRTSLFPTGKGYHRLLVNKRMQAGADARAGDTAQFQLEPDLEKREAVLPMELKRALAEDRSLLRWFDKLSYSIRKWISDWVSQVKSAEARERRAQQVAEQLLSTMEAERELPPVLKAAFARDPRALQGWQLMSPTRRRGQLLAIFYYRNPESRNRRVAKVIKEALALAERKSRKSAVADES
ncbi:MAG TPA: YdeI/OmpD-associated family protein [Candidatus Acidoferrum sp.]|nr:YdeI/OmpD-associated family protein [Candidatus Acidoferrum sp.]